VPDRYELQGKKTADRSRGGKDGRREILFLAAVCNLPSAISFLPSLSLANPLPFVIFNAAESFSVYYVYYITYDRVYYMHLTPYSSHH
jgi:hypothetical protein